VSNLTEKLLAPISGTAHCGEDGSYDSRFEACKAEAEKITGTDWNAMAESGEIFLSQTSKDMRVFGFLALAKGVTSGITALAEVMQVYAETAMSHWDDIFPKRPNGRIQALKWLVSDSVKNRLETLAGTGDYETLSQAALTLKKFQEFIFGKFPEQPSFEAFTAIVYAWGQKNKPPEPPPTPEPGSEPEPAAPASDTLSLGTEEDAYLALQRVGGFFYEQNPLNPLSFRLMRLARWSAIPALPPSQGGKTMVPAPYPDTLAAFRNLHAQADWTHLSVNGEEAFTTDGMLFWFDLQRYLCDALEGLGGEQAACARAIKQELALLLQRIPGLEALSFDDGTPFADGMTREWLETQVLGSLGGDGVGSPRKGKKKSDIGQEMEEAEKLFAMERLEEALAVYKTGMATDTSAKNNFNRRLRMAELCLRAGKPMIAATIGEELKGFADTVSLETWDPETCILLFRLLRKAYHGLAESGMDPTGTLPARALEALSRLARLDPLAAVQSESSQY